MTGDTDPRLHPCPHPSLTPGPGQCAPVLHTTRPVSFTPHVLQADFVSHHSSCKRTCFTPLVLKACMLHTIRPVRFTPHVLQAHKLHTTHPASLHASHHSSCEIHTTHSGSLHPPHHMSWEPIWLHTTRLASRLCPTPPRL